MSVRKSVIVGIVAVAAVIVVLVAALGGSGDHSTVGLSSGKVAQLAKFGITPKQYLAASRRGAEREKALRASRPPDPSVAGPAVISESLASQLIAWRQHYRRLERGDVREKWRLTQVAPERSIVTLRFVGPRGQAVGTPARWALNFSLTAPATPAQEERINGPNAVQPLNAAARQLEGFPPPGTAVDLPVALYAFEGLSPGSHLVIVSIVPGETYPPELIVRKGVFDEALLRGKRLTRHPPRGEHYLKLSRTVHIFEETFKPSQPRRRSSIYRLNNLFKSGPVPLLLGWRHSASSAPALLHRPVEELTILGQ